MPRPFWTAIMVNDLYNKAILTLAGNIERAGRLADPDASVFLDSPLCGSRITVDIRMQDDKVSDYAAEVKACALGQAASAIMAKHVIGQTGAQLRQVRDAMRAMLKSHAPPRPANGGSWKYCSRWPIIRPGMVRSCCPLKR